MITFTKITVQNFLSFGNKPTEVTLDTKEMTLIIGTNKDVGEEGYSKNGAGKTTLFQALCWSLYGNGINDIKQDGFINIKNKTRMLVEVEFDIDGARYTVVRGRKPNRTEMTKNGQPFTLSTAANVDEAIVFLLGMDLEVFLATVVLSTNTNAFMSRKPAQQRDFMERILSMDLLSQRAGAVKVIKADTVAEIKGEERAVQEIERANERIANNINSLETKAAAWDSERSAGTNHFETELAELKAVDTDTEMARIDELDALHTEVKEVSGIIDAAAKEVDRMSAIIDRLNTELASLESGKCPYCEQSYDNRQKIDSVVKEIGDLSAEMELMGIELDPHLTREDELNAQITEFTTANPDLLSRADVQEIINESRVLEARIADLRRDVVNPYLDQIETLKTSLKEVDKTTLHELRSIESHCTILVKLLTDSKSFVRRNIIEQYIPFINSRINTYLDALQLAHGVLIDNDLSVEMEYMGSPLSYGNLSNGERLRVNLAVNLAFRDLLAASGVATNLLVLDEVLDAGSDASFFHSTIKLLREKAGTSIFVVSHRDEIKTMVDSIMTVVKEGGFSTISIDRAA